MADNIFMKTTPSTCRACLANNCKMLHRQFFVLPGVTEKVSYDIMVCSACGFIFADNIPRQEKLDIHYQEAEHHLHPNIPPGLATIHQDFFDFIKQRIPLLPSTKILDIGCGAGHFLNLFKHAGHQSVLGLEPSRHAKQKAASLYGIEVVQECLNSFQSSHNFDLITLCGVLEHIPDLRASLTKIRQLAKPNSYLFIAVPDAASFGETPSDEPFLEFAIEHINFFTQDSLKILIERHGFKTLHTKSIHNNFYNNNYIYLLCQAHSLMQPTYINDLTGKASIGKYIQQSNLKTERICKTINELSDIYNPTVIWGAGSLATRLCVAASVEKLNLLGFVDRNPQLHGHTLLGKTIHPPEWLHGQDKTNTALIFSTTYSSEIEKTLRDQYDWIGRVIRLDQII